MRPGLWVGSAAALFDHRCIAPQSARPTEFFVSAPCIVLVRRGAFRTCSALGDYLADPSTAVMRNALAGYRVEDLRDLEHSATTLRIAPAAARDLLRPLDPAGADRDVPMFRLGSAPVPPAARLLHAAIMRALEQPFVDDLLIEESVLRLAGIMVNAAFPQAGQPPRVTRRARDCVEAAKALMVRRARERLTLSDVAKGAGCSEFHLARAFAAVTGATIHRHLKRLRLSLGLEQLLASNDGVTQIAVSCGFCDHSHFTSAFKREFGLTPSQARGAGLRALPPRPPADGRMPD